MSILSICIISGQTFFRHHGLRYANTKSNLLQFNGKFSTCYLYFRSHTSYTMPRSNKKKHDNCHQGKPPDEDTSVAQLLNRETLLMISRAIVSILLQYLYTQNSLFQCFTGQCSETWNRSKTWNF